LGIPSTSHWTGAANGVVYEKRADGAWYILDDTIYVPWAAA